MTEAGGGGLDTEWIPGQHCSPGQGGESQALLPGQSSGWGLVSGQTGLAYRLANTQATGTQATGNLATRVTEPLAKPTCPDNGEISYVSYALQRGWGPF